MGEKIPGTAHIRWNMKKLTILILALILSVMAIVGCNKDKNNTQPNNGETTVTHEPTDKSNRDKSNGFRPDDYKSDFSTDSDKGVQATDMP